MDGAEEVPFVPLFKAPHHIEFLSKVFFFLETFVFFFNLNRFTRSMGERSSPASLKS